MCKLALRALRPTGAKASKSCTSSVTGLTYRPATAPMTPCLTPTTKEKRERAGAKQRPAWALGDAHRGMEGKGIEQKTVRVPPVRVVPCVARRLRLTHAPFPSTPYAHPFRLTHSASSRSRGRRSTAGGEVSSMSRASEREWE